MILTKLEYLRRFTQDERIAVRAAADVNPVLADYMALLELAQEIDTEDADTVAAVGMLELAGLIGAGRAAEIIAEPVVPIPVEATPFIATNRVDGVDVMVEQDGTVRYADGKWTTLDTLAAQNKTVEAL